MSYKRKNDIGFKFAIQGILLGFKERNFIIHNLITLCVIIAGFIFNISMLEWCVVVFCIGFVLALELLNTAIENIVNELSPQHSLFAKNTKDIAAAAVLIAAITSVVIGLIIFVPKIIKILL